MNQEQNYQHQLHQLDTPDWRPDQTGTLLFLKHDDAVLLIHKLTGHGAGKVNGPGGKLEAGETPLQCALRETREEVGITVPHAEHRGTFRFFDLVTEDWLGYIFVADRFSGEPSATPEAEPFWCPLDALPFDRMWPDDRLWLPRVLAGERLRGSFLFEDSELRAHVLRRDAGEAS